MKIKVTYRRAGMETDLVVTCDSSTTVGAVATYLRSSDPDMPSRSVGQVTLCLPDEANRVLPPESTVLDSYLKSGQVVSLADAAIVAARTDQPPAAVLTIEEGPEKGKVFPLVYGPNVIGRGADVPIRLSDPLVSRTHAQVIISDSPEIVDLGSANGVLVQGQQVDRQVLHAGDRVEVGDSVFTIQLLRSGATEGRVESSATGFIRSPRLVKQYEGPTFPVPEIPRPPQKQRFQVSMLVTPIFMAAAMWFMTHQLMSVIFMGMMPLMMIGTYLDNVIGGKATYKRDMKQWRVDMKSLLEEVYEEAQAEVSARAIEHPSTRECADGAARLTNLLWTRRTDSPGFAELRLGMGTLPSRIVFDTPDLKQATHQARKEMEDLLEPYTLVEPVPVVCRLHEHGGLGVAGPRNEAAGVARALVAQAVCLHSPNDFHVAVVASPQTGENWDWVKWLPHVSAPGGLSARVLAATASDAASLLGEIEELIASRPEVTDMESDKDNNLPALLLVVEYDAPVEFGRLVNVVEKGWSHGVYVLWIAPDMKFLPAACRVYVDVASHDTGSVGYLHEGDLVTPVALESFGADEVRQWARHMAPVTDVATRSDDASDVPRVTMYTSVVGKRVLNEPDSVIERWKENSSIVTGPFAPEQLSRKTSNLRAAIGQSVQGFHSLDLRFDGPHALIGGTTGAGKSELLQTWVLAMALNHSPQRLNFLLVDYKGGSAFAECADLPHTVGLVTDLDSAGVHRALASLSAELHYRELVLGARKAKDLIAMEKSDPIDAPPSLVIVVDEFAALVQEVPDFVDGVVNVAQRGRSLGLHLILATQRPAGVIRDNLRANTNLRIALRVADTDDSNDVLGSPMAAYFDADLPGRAVSKTGPGRLVTFQTAYVGGHTGSEEPPPDISVETLGFGAPVVWEAPVVESFHSGQPEESDLKRIVSTIQQAKTVAGLPNPRKPWLPDLAKYYNLADGTQVPQSSNDAELIFGIADDPDHQMQPPVSYSPDVVGNMAIYGAGGSGKSTMLRTLAIVAGTSFQRGPCHVYGLDFSSRGLAMLADLPHVGAIIDGGDDERVQRLLRWLRGLIDERAAKYSEVNAATIAEYRSISGHRDEARILLLVDGVAAFRQAYEAGQLYRFWDMFVSIAADGRPVGVNVVMTVDQVSGIPGPLGATVQQRVIMRLASEDDYGNFNVPKGVLTEKSPAGRCVVGDLTAQVAILGGEPSIEAKHLMAAAHRASEGSGGEWIPPVDAQSQAANIRLFGAAMRKAGAGDAPSIQRLSEDIDVTTLTAEPGCFALGVASDDFSTIQVTASGPFILAGPPGSGVSTGLGTIIKGLRGCADIDQVHVFSDRATDVGRGIADSVTIGADQVVVKAQELLDAMSAAGEDGPRLGLIIEGLADFGNSVAEMALANLIQGALKSGHFVACSGDPATMSSAYSLMPPFKAGRRAMVLQFDSDSPDLVQAVYPRARATDFPVGRGVYAYRGRARIVQVAR